MEEKLIKEIRDRNYDIWCRGFLAGVIISFLTLVYFDLCHSLI